MKRSVLVIAPHPDDETLGCGGTLLKHRAAGDELHWLIVTEISSHVGASPERSQERQAEIARVTQEYSFASVHQLGFPTTQLDSLPLSDLVAKMGRVFAAVRPEIVYLPHPGDIHTDHRVVFEAAASCTKWFRAPFVKRVLAYETLSETDFGINPAYNPFRPNYFVDISGTLERKMAIMRIFSSELGEFPFPRSEEALSALAAVRGTAAGFRSAEAFMLLKETWS